MVFDLWIVVASIKKRVHRLSGVCASFYVMQIFLMPACSSALFGVGVCVGDSFFGFVL